MLDFFYYMLFWGSTCFEKKSVGLRLNEAQTFVYFYSILWVCNSLCHRGKYGNPFYFPYIILPWSCGSLCNWRWHQEHADTHNMQPKSDIWRLIWHFLTQNDTFFVIHSELTGLLKDLFLTSLFFSLEVIQVCM